MEQKGAELWQQQEEQQQDTEEVNTEQAGMDRCMSMEMLHQRNRFCHRECRSQDRYVKKGQAVRCGRTVTGR